MQSAEFQKDPAIFDLQFLALSNPFLPDWKSLIACWSSSSVVITNGPKKPKQCIAILFQVGLVNSAQLFFVCVERRVVEKITL